MEYSGDEDEGEGEGEEGSKTDEDIEAMVNQLARIFSKLDVAHIHATFVFCQRHFSQTCKVLQEEINDYNADAEDYSDNDADDKDIDDDDDDDDDGQVRRHEKPLQSVVESDDEKEESVMRREHLREQQERERQEQHELNLRERQEQDQEQEQEQLHEREQQQERHLEDLNGSSGSEIRSFDSRITKEEVKVAIDDSDYHKSDHRQPSKAESSHQDNVAEDSETTTSGSINKEKREGGESCDSEPSGLWNMVRSNSIPNTEQSPNEERFNSMTEMQEKAKAIVTELANSSKEIENEETIERLVLNGKVRPDESCEISSPHKKKSMRLDAYLLELKTMTPRKTNIRETLEYHNRVDYDLNPQRTYLRMSRELDIVEKFLIDGFRVTDVESIVLPKAAAEFKKKWKEFKKKYGEGVPESQSVIGYHGTEAENIQIIMKKGFERKLFSDRVYGKGIYLGVEPRNCVGYCTGGGKLLVVAALPGRTRMKQRRENYWNSDKSDSIHIGGTRVMKKTSQVLPLYIISFQDR